MSSRSGFRTAVLGAVMALAACGGSATPAPSTAPASPASPAANAGAKPAAAASASAAAPAASGTALVRRGAVGLQAVEWPNFIAQKLGYYAREGLRVETTVIQPNALVPALTGGSEDLGIVSGTDLIFADEKGTNLVGIGEGQDPIPYAFMTPPAIKAIADLKGKTVGAATPQDVYTTVLKQILQKGGLDPEKDVNFIFGPSSAQRVAALEAGGIQAGLIPPPIDADLTAKGYNTLAFTPDYYPKLTLSLTATSRDWATVHSDVLRRFMKTQADANTWLNDPKNKDEAIQILADGSKTSVAAAAHAYDMGIVKYPSFPKDACVQAAGMEAVLKILTSTGQIQGNPPVNKYIDTQWCAK